MTELGKLLLSTIFHQFLRELVLVLLDLLIQLTLLLALGICHLLVPLSPLVIESLRTLGGRLACINFVELLNLLRDESLRCEVELAGIAFILIKFGFLELVVGFLRCFI